MHKMTGRVAIVTGAGKGVGEGIANVLAEAGATVPQIASVSGHSIEATQRILETYLPKNRALAQIAITRLAEYKPRPESNASLTFRG